MNVYTTRAVGEAEILFHTVDLYYLFNNRGEIFSLISSRFLEEPPIGDDSRAPYTSHLSSVCKASEPTSQIKTFKTLIEIRLVRISS